jgi:hypothetical protein
MSLGRIRIKIKIKILLGSCPPLAGENCPQVRKRSEAISEASWRAVSFEAANARSSFSSTL